MNSSIRDSWRTRAYNISSPVFAAANESRLTVELSRLEFQGGGGLEHSRQEAICRTCLGLAPWFQSAGRDGDDLGIELAAAARSALEVTLDPDSPDHLHFGLAAQSLVEAANLCQAFLRAPDGLWNGLSDVTKQRFIEKMRETRTIFPYLNNWMLFASVVETFLGRETGEFDYRRLEPGLLLHEDWYCGDGVWGDGRRFHWDYYNSFVIQPMLIDVLDHFDHPLFKPMVGKVAERNQRYATILERMVAPDGSYPAIGRSLVYRCGAFQALALAALRTNLAFPPARARRALDLVIRRTLDPAGTFEGPWLRPGLCGHQPTLPDAYISTGSLYLCTTAFLPLGLAPTSAFWSDPEVPTTSELVWSGADVHGDHALTEYF